MLIIFDWDGTLCNSIDHIVEAMHDAAGELGLSAPSEAAVKDIVGLGLPEAIARLFPSLAPAQRETVAASYSRHFADPARAPARLFEGAMDTLCALRDRGLELAVATGKSRRGLDRVLRSLDMSNFFEATRCADETRSKPHPLMVQQLMDVRGKGRQDTVVVGDSEYDLDMARQAGVRSVAVSYGVHESERLALFSPLAMVHSLPELLELPVFNS